MFTYLLGVILAVTAPVSQTKPYDYHINIAHAQTASLDSSLLEVSDIPHPPENLPLAEKIGEDIAQDDFDHLSSPEAIVGLKNDVVASDEDTAGSLYNELGRKEEIEEITRLIQREFGVEWVVALTVARCESELKPKAKNKHSTAKGIFQILDGTWKHFKCEGDPLNAEDNIVCGKKVLDGQGLGGGWSESFSCWKNI